MLIKPERAGDKAGDTGKGQACSTMQAGARGHYFILRATGTIKGYKLGKIHLSLYPETSTVALSWGRCTKQGRAT